MTWSATVAGVTRPCARQIAQSGSLASCALAFFRHLLVQYQWCHGVRAEGRLSDIDAVSSYPEEEADDQSDDKLGTVDAEVADHVRLRTALTSPT
jgi:hypothetical protein